MLNLNFVNKRGCFAAPQKKDEWLSFAHLAADSTNIYAERSSAFPRGFWEVKREIYDLFDSVSLKQRRWWMFWKRRKE